MHNPNSSYGRASFDALHGIVPAFGRVFVVLSESDAGEERYDRLQEILRPTYGTVMFFTSLSDAYDATTSNNNDVILVDADTTHTLTEMLTVAKNRVHFIGMDGLVGENARRYGQRTKVSLGVTTAVTDLATIKVTGVGCTFRNIKFINNNTVDEGLYCFLDAGEYTYVENCEIYKSTDLDEDGAAELVANGDSSHYKNCFIGSTANIVSATGARPCVLVTGGIVSGKKARDVTFEGCVFARKAGAVGNRMVYGANATDIERMMWFKDCLFYNNLLAAADPAQAIAFGSAQTQGSAIAQGCASVSCTAFSTTTGVFTSDPASDAAGPEAAQAA